MITIIIVIIINTRAISAEVDPKEPCRDLRDEESAPCAATQPRDTFIEFEE
jgi:hypothetical protein